MTDLEQILRKLKTDAAPRESFRTNARIRILNVVGKPVRFRARHWGYAIGAGLAAAVLSVGTVFAAQSSLPGNILYPVKVLTENIALQTAPTKQLKTTVADTIVERRTEEVKKSETETEKIRSMKNFDATVEALKKRADVNRDHLDKIIEKQEQELKIPETPAVRGDSVIRRREND